MSDPHLENVQEHWDDITRMYQNFEHKDAIIEFDVVRLQILAYPAEEYLDGLSNRTREQTRRQHRQAVAEGALMMFARDEPRQVFRSHVCQWRLNRGPVSRDRGPLAQDVSTGSSLLRLRCHPEGVVFLAAKVAPFPAARNKTAEWRPRNVWEIIAPWTLRGSDARIANVRSLEMFQAEAKWEMSNQR